jgi:hypothetical protein
MGLLVDDVGEENRNCGKCGGTGELYRLYDKKEEKLVRIRKSSEYRKKFKDDRYRMPEESDGELTHPYPTCPSCGGDGIAEKDWR